MFQNWNDKDWINNMRMPKEAFLYLLDEFFLFTLKQNTNSPKAVQVTVLVIITIYFFLDLVTIVLLLILYYLIYLVA